MTNAELIDLFRNVEQSNHPVCNGCPMKYTCDKDQITRCLFGAAADALEEADEKIADCVAAIDALDDSNDAYIKENERLKKRIVELEAQIGNKYCLIKGVLPEEHGDLVDRDESNGLREIEKAWEKYLESERAAEKIAVKEELNRRRRELEEIKTEKEKNMDIITNKKDKKRNFEKIEIGTAFTWREGYYMKTNDCLVGGGVRNAVDLVTGDLVYFDCTYSILAVPMAVHVCE